MNNMLNRGEYKYKYLGLLPQYIQYSLDAVILG